MGAAARQAHRMGAQAAPGSLPEDPQPAVQRRATPMREAGSAPGNGKQQTHTEHSTG